MNYIKKFFFLFFILIVQFFQCTSFTDPYDDNAKMFIEDGHITFESAHNKDINFKTNFGKIMLNGIEIQDIHKKLNSIKDKDLNNINSNEVLLRDNTKVLKELKEQLKDYKSLVSDVKKMKDLLKLMLNDNKLKPDVVYKSITNGQKVQKQLKKLKSLFDINECSSMPCKNKAACLDLYGTYLCQCTDGWTGKNCEQDINECELYSGTDLGCKNGAQCVNTQGSFHCICQPGFQGTHCASSNISTNPCNQATNNELCGHGKCISSSKTNLDKDNYSCICEPGWKSIPPNVACVEDIDECELHKVWVKRILKDKETDLKNLPNEICSIKPLVECINTQGSFKCGPCPKGFIGNGQTCIDINECEINNGGCSTTPFVQCINTLGSNTCGPCPAEYTGDGKTCNLKMNFNNNEPKIYDSDRHNYDEPCPNNPCINEGACYLKNNTDKSINKQDKMQLDDFYCSCEMGFKGKYCETIINYCITENDQNQSITFNGPCKNNGTCINMIGGFNCLCDDNWTGETCETPKDECGSLLQNDNGTIKFPSKNIVIAPNKNSFNCEWKIESPLGKVVEITVKNFSLGFTNFCYFDYLKISDGIPSITPFKQLAKLCGSFIDLPKNSTMITSIHSYVTIELSIEVAYYLTNNQKDAFNFELDYKFVDPVCGGRINSSNHGSISSPGYPSGYPQQSNCIWIIETSLNKRIQLYFAGLSIEGDSNCANDYVQIFDGQSENDPSLGIFCNTTIPPPITSSGPFVLIHFVSDVFYSDKGFHLTYNSISTIQNCGGLLTNDKDYISSPHFPVKYQNNLECDYLIRLKNPNEKIKLTISFIELENHINCKYDYLDIYDGPNEYSPKFGRFCSNKTTNKKMVSSSNTMFIKFRSDNTYRGNGFVLSYEVFCGGVFNELEDKILSPGYPKLSDNNLCHYLITVPNNYLIKLEFKDLDLEYTKNCTNDSLTLNEANNNLKEINKFCGSTTPDVFISDFNNLLIILKNKIGSKFRGFSLNYTTINIGCGGTLKENPGYFSSPSNGKNYKSNSKCNWIIKAPTNQIIKLTFNTFSLEKQSICKFDYVKVMDSQFNQIGKYCSNQIPPLIQSIDNELIVQFVSDKSNQFEGFTASYVFLNSSSTCGGTIAQNSGEITSPDFYNRKKYFPNLNCVWKIVAEINQQIRLNFTFLDLESNDCAYDYLEIHNGPEINSPLLAKVCGNSKPPIIISHSNQIVIHLVTDSNKEAKGFKLNYDTALTGCGGVLTSPTGSISSPNYPNPYIHNAECDYLIFVSKGSIINMNFVEIDIEPQETCPFDYVEVYDGKNEFSPKIGKFCNLKQNPGTIKSTSNAILIRFRSDESIGKKGFLLNYHTNCTNILKGYRGVIESLNYPIAYSDSFNCNWKIIVPAGNIINIVFTNLQLDCPKSSLIINEVSNESIQKNLTKSYCDTKNNTELSNILNFNSTNNEVEIIFEKKSVPDVKSISLFRLEYYLLGCGGEFLYKPRGTIQTPGYPKTHKNQLDCVWHIYTTPGNRIILDIIDFDIATGSKCIHGYLKILGGPSLDSIELGKLCDKPAEKVTLSSTSSSMTIVLKNDLGISSKGFSAQFYIRYDNKCGGTFNLEEGVIMSPNYPGLYDYPEDCYYHITSTGLKQIEVTLVDLKLPLLSNCTGGELIIYDDDYVSSKPLKRDCGQNFTSNNLQNTFVSSGNKMMIRFKANDHSVNKAFKLTYKVKCGGSLTLLENQNFILSSPNYPFLSKNKPSICSWTFICDINQKMAITVTHLEPYFNNFPNSTTLQFYSGTALDAPLINSYSNVIPSTIVTPGNKMTIKSQNIVFRLKIDTQTNSCGGLLKVTNSGELASPGYPNNYPLDIQCSWTILSGYSNRIQLEFIDFNLQKSDFCNIDYLELRENDQYGSLIGRFCGNELPSIDNNFLHELPSFKNTTITNTTKTYRIGFNKIWIRFKSQNTGTDRGFRLKYSLIKEIFLLQDFGLISSPQYPTPIIGRESLTWHISSSESTIIKLNVKNIQLPVLRNSICYNFLKIYDGFTIDRDNEIEKICGLEIKDKPIYSTGNQMTIQYQSVGSSLFLLEFKAINSFEYLSENITTVVLQKNCTDCIQELFLNQSSLNIISPGYPNGYDINLVYEWTIKASLGKKIEIKINDLNIEEGNCLYDKLEFYDKDTEDNIFLNKTLCGSNKQNLITNSNFAKIIFKSDAVGNGTGFNISLSPVCGGYIFGRSFGNLEFNAGQNDNFKCDWVISVNKRRKIKMNFDFIHFSQSKNNDCSENFVVLRDGPLPTSPLIGKYCGQTTENLFINQTSTSKVYVTFYALKGLFQTFNLKYEEIRFGCKQNYYLYSKDDVITIESPNYPNPPPIVECDWVFTSPASTLIRIDFNLLNSNIPCNLSEQALTVFDGGSIYSPVVIRDCPRISSVRTTENVMYVNYVTNGENLHAAFRAKVQVSVCGGNYIISSRTFIKSKNYPSKYLNNLDCKYYLKSYLSHYSLNIRITKLDLAGNLNLVQESSNTSDSVIIKKAKQNSTDCDFAGDFIEFRDTDENGAILGRFCNSNPTQVFSVSSTTDKVFMKFKTDSELTGNGFRVEVSLKLNFCGKTIKATKGAISFLNQQNSISYARKCIWELIGDTSSRIEITFKKSKLKFNPKNQSECIDTLNFYSKPINLIKNNILKINTDTSCNFLPKQKIISFGHTLVIVLSTIGLEPNEGFEIEYDATKEAVCGGYLTSSQGSFEISEEKMLSFLPKKKIPSSYACLWYISPNITLSNYTFSLFFDQFEFPEPSDLNIKNLYKSISYGENIGRALTLPIAKTSRNTEYCGKSSVYFGASQKNFEKISFFNFELCGNFSNKGLYYVYSSLSSHTPLIYAHIERTNEIKKLKVDFTLNNCGGSFDKLGTFSSPNYPNNYNNDALCIWTINSYQSGKLKIVFEDFDLEEDCKNDYVEILNGNLLNYSPSLGRFCGKQKPPELITSESTAAIIFKTNKANVKKGFKFTVSKYESGLSCGSDIKLMTTYSRSVYSPSYPNAYKNNLNCVWEVTVNPNYHINIEFNSRFDIEKSINCTNDYLMVEEKLSKSSWQILNKYCGLELPKPLIAKSNTVRLTFNSNNNLTGDGFRLSLKSECGRTLTDNFGYIQSPFYPSNYDLNLNCDYIFNRKQNEFIILKLEDFEINDCPNDFVSIDKVKSNNSTQKQNKLSVIEIKNLNNNLYTKNLGPFCGTNKPPELITSNEYLKLSFKTDYVGTSKGFKFNYKVIKCGENFENVNYGVITSPNQDENYYINNADCYWNIKVSENSSISMRIESLGLELCGRTCHCDYLEIFEIVDNSTQVLAKICGHDKYPIIKSDTNKVLIHFHSDHTGSFNGFKLIFSSSFSKKQGCGGTIMANETGFIESPHIKNKFFYDNNLDCIWTITASSNQVIKLSFETFKLEDKNNLTSKCVDYLQINDGTSSVEPLIDVFCGKIKPDAIQSSSNHLFLYFKTNSNIQFEGFKLKYEMIEKTCGGLISIVNNDLKKNESSFLVVSPNYPNSYPLNIRCKWVVLTSYFFRIQLNINEFNLNCSNNDYLQFSNDRNHENLIKICTKNDYLENKSFVVTSGIWIIFNSGQGKNQNNLLADNNVVKNNKEIFKFKLSYKVLDCNQTYNSENGLIVSSKYPSVWSSVENEYCYFKIETKFGRTISVYFNEFLIGRTNSSCKDNRMEIKDGKSVNSKRLAILCGSEIPNPIFSTENILSFNVIATNTYNKYKMYFVTTDKGIGCGGNLTSFNGTFTSPLYPNRYNEKKTCIWNVHSLGQNGLNIQFKEIDFGDKNNCDFNYLEVYEGNEIKQDNLIKKICNQELIANYISDSNFIIFKMVINDTSLGVKFKIKYSISKIRGSNKDFNDHIFSSQSKDTYLYNDASNLIIN